ncbi:MAG: hypothetical protein JW884_07005 [Deltaproteobacteria bacterium]|nr:hypothetical protein [Deltaproteobacteria bacterium]
MEQHILLQHKKEYLRELLSVTELLSAAIKTDDLKGAQANLERRRRLMGHIDAIDGSLSAAAVDDKHLATEGRQRKLPNVAGEIASMLERMAELQGQCEEALRTNREQLLASLDAVRKGQRGLRRYGDGSPGGKRQPRFLDRTL